MHVVVISDWPKSRLLPLFWPSWRVTTDNEQKNRNMFGLYHVAVVLSFLRSISLALSYSCLFLSRLDLSQILRIPAAFSFAVPCSLFFKLRDLCMDFEPCFEVHNLVVTQLNNTKLGQMTNVNVISFMVVSIYKLEQICNSTQSPAQPQSGLLTSQLYYFQSPVLRGIVPNRK